MTKIVVNNCFGRFLLSTKAVKWLRDKYHITDDELFDLKRHDPRLVDCVETLKEESSDSFLSEPKIVEIDSDKYYIESYDGLETVITPDIIEKRWEQIKK